MAGVADIIWTGIGGGTGSVLRWAVARLINERTGAARQSGDFPLATFVINVSGTFLIGFLAVLLSDNWLSDNWLSDNWLTDNGQGHRGSGLNMALTAGLLGGYTTFSTMELEAAQQMRGGRTALAVFYLFLSLAIGLLAALAGGWCATLLR